MTTAEIILGALSLLYGLVFTLASFMLRRMWDEIDRNRKNTDQLFSMSTEIRLGHEEFKTEVARTHPTNQTVAEMKREILDRFDSFEKKLENLVEKINEAKG